jgi:methylenetetrahydrofolate dehydrogenase (NADP+)/methenyltetrahydrofolate cyclohydrolase
MSAQILDGKALAEKVIEECKKKTITFKPGLGVILVGDNLASRVYVGNKKKLAEKAGINSFFLELPKQTPDEELLPRGTEGPDTPALSGFIVQLPLPEHIDEKKILEAIDPKKDVDGFHAYNLGRMVQNKNFEILPPATPAGIIQILEEYNIELEGKEVVVVGRSNIVGKPISLMLLNRNATVTVCHSRTKNLAEHTKRADILIVSVGKAGTITEDMVREGVVVIDVGINRADDGRLVGDVEFEEVSKKASFITPVPGGVGPMTAARLIANTIRAAETYCLDYPAPMIRTSRIA